MKKHIKMTVIVGALLTGVLSAQAGKYDLKGIFMIVNESGYALSDVDVSYNINNGGWRSCGTSGKSTELGSGYINKGRNANFIQYQPCFPEGGSRVSWRFRKHGYKEIVITEKMPPYPNGTGKDVEKFQKVRMIKLKSSSDRSHKERSSSSEKSSELPEYSTCPKYGTRTERHGVHGYKCSRCRGVLHKQ